jgi:hypothetical protein
VIDDAVGKDFRAGPDLRIADDAIGADLDTRRKTALMSMNTSRPTVISPRMSMRCGSAKVAPASISSSARSRR